MIIIKYRIIKSQFQNNLFPGIFSLRFIFLSTTPTRSFIGFAWTEEEAAAVVQLVAANIVCDAYCASLFSFQHTTVLLSLVCKQLASLCLCKTRFAMNVHLCCVTQVV